MPTEQMEAGEARANALAIGARALNQFFNWLAADVRTEQDALKIQEEGASVAHRDGGVLIVRTTGHLSDEEAGGDFQQYLGIRIAGGGKTEQSAKQNYFRGLRESKRERRVPTTCTVDNISGRLSGSPAVMSADNRSEIYRQYLGEHVMRQNEYAVKNPNAYIRTEYLFFTQEQWDTYIFYARRKRRSQ